MDTVAVYTVVNITGNQQICYKQNICKSGSTLNVVNNTHTLNMGKTEILTLSKQSTEIILLKFMNGGYDPQV